MRVLFFLFLLFITNIGAQEFLDPINTNSFGLNNHTNRDISYFTLVDNNGEIINIGTTERDSTHTDILISKFDTDLNLTWQKRHSIDTGLSYDIPLDLYIDSGNNIIVVGKSSYKQSTSNGLIFAIKYNASGVLLWEKTLGNIDGSDYYDYSFYSSSFENEVLRIAYAKNQQNAIVQINYVTLDDVGNYTETLTTNSRIDGAVSIYKNGYYYTLIRVNEDDGNYDDQFYLIKKNQTNEIIYHLNYIDNFVFDNFTSVIYYTKIHVDNEENIYLVKKKVEGTGFVTYTKLNNVGEIEFSKQVPENQNHIGSYIDNTDLLNIIYYDQSGSSISQRLIDNEGNESIINELSFPNYYGGELKNDSTLFVINSFNDINLYDQNLTFINSFKFSNYYELTDIARLNNSNIVTSGTSYDKMYPESDFLAQRNIILERMDTIEVNNNYMYSGEGTSKVVGITVLVDNDNNYLVLSEEQMGPENWQIGGSRPPINKSVYKYDSNLNLIWRTELPNKIFTESNFLVDAKNNLYINTLVPTQSYTSYYLTKISSDGEIIFQVLSSDFGARQMHFDKDQNIVRTTWPISRSTINIDDTHIYTHNSDNGELINTTSIEHYEIVKTYNAPNGDSYMYFYAEEDPNDDSEHKLRLYKNLNLEFTISLNITGTNGTILIDPQTMGVDSNGTLFFSSVGGHDANRLHKVTLTGNYKYHDIEDELRRLKVLLNGQVLILQDNEDENGLAFLYDSDFNLLTDYPQSFFKYSILFEYKDYIFINDYPFHNYTDYYVYVLNRTGQIIDRFQLPSNLSYAKIDQNEDFVLTGTFGNQIYLYTYYGWYRGLLNKYSYDGPLDSDGDGIGDNIDECPDTPSGELINETGCSQSQIDDDNDGVMNDKDDCPETPDGEPVDENGCSQSQLDDDNDGVMNNVDECPNSLIPSLVDERGCFYLPANNFTIETFTETCPDKNNGQIIISTIENLDYVATVNGIAHSFNSDLTINNLAPGSYEICITVSLVSYEQCYNIILEEGVEVSATSSVESNILYIDMAGGTLPYNVIKNGEVVFQTRLASFSLQVEHGDNIVVKTNRYCEGSFNKNISFFNSFIVYPNPTTGLVEITLPMLSTNHFKIEVFNIHSQLMYTSFHSNNSKATLDLKNMPSGVYFAKLNLKEPVILKIIKQ